VFVPVNGFHAECQCYIKIPHVFKTQGGAPPHCLDPRSNTAVCIPLCLPEAHEDNVSLYCEVKLDITTKEYCIGTPVSNNVQRHRRQGSLQHILSPTAQDDTGIVILY